MIDGKIKLWCISSDGILCMGWRWSEVADLKVFFCNSFGLVEVAKLHLLRTAG